MKNLGSRKGPSQAVRGSVFSIFDVSTGYALVVGYNKQEGGDYETG